MNSSIAPLSRIDSIQPQNIFIILIWAVIVEVLCWLTVGSLLDKRWLVSACYAAVTLGSHYRTIFKIGRADSIFSPIGSV